MFSATAIYVALWAIVIFQGLLILALLRRLAALQSLAVRHFGTPLETLQIGSIAPEIEGLDLRSGERVAIEIRTAGAVVLFLSPRCPSCSQLLEHVQQLLHPDAAPIVCLCESNEEACGELLTRVGPKFQVVLDPGGNIAKLYGISVFPTAIAIDVKRKIRGYANPKTLADLEQLISYTREDEAQPKGQPHVSTVS